MSIYLDFENEKYEKGFKPFSLTRDNIKKNIGKRICFVRRWPIDRYRGYYKVEFARMYGIRYSELYINEEKDNSIDIRDVVECGIEIEKTEAVANGS